MVFTVRLILGAILLLSSCVFLPTCGRHTVRRSLSERMSPILNETFSNITNVVKEEPNVKQTQVTKLKAVSKTEINQHKNDVYPAENQVERENSTSITRGSEEKQATEEAISKNQKQTTERVQNGRSINVNNEKRASPEIHSNLPYTSLLSSESNKYTKEHKTSTYSQYPSSKYEFTTVKNEDNVRNIKYARHYDIETSTEATVTSSTSKIDYRKFKQTEINESKNRNHIHNEFVPEKIASLNTDANSNETKFVDETKKEEFNKIPVSGSGTEEEISGKKMTIKDDLNKITGDGLDEAAQDKTNKISVTGTNTHGKMYGNSQEIHKISDRKSYKPTPKRTDLLRMKPVKNETENSVLDNKITPNLKKSNYLEYTTSSDIDPITAEKEYEKSPEQNNISVFKRGSTKSEKKFEISAQTNPSEAMVTTISTKINNNDKTNVTNSADTKPNEIVSETHNYVPTIASNTNSTLPESFDTTTAETFITTFNEEESTIYETTSEAEITAIYDLTTQESTVHLDEDSTIAKGSTSEFGLDSTTVFNDILTTKEIYNLTNESTTQIDSSSAAYGEEISTTEKETFFPVTGNNASLHTNDVLLYEATEVTTKEGVNDNTIDIANRTTVFEQDHVNRTNHFFTTPHTTKTEENSTANEIRNNDGNARYAEKENGSTTTDNVKQNEVNVNDDGPTPKKKVSSTTEESVNEISKDNGTVIQDIDDDSDEAEEEYTDLLNNKTAQSNAGGADTDLEPEIDNQAPKSNRIDTQSTSTSKTVKIFSTTERSIITTPSFEDEESETTTSADNQELIAEDEDNSGKIAAIVISTVGAICLFLLAALLIIMRKRQKRFNYGQRCRPVSLDAYSMDNVSIHNSARRKGVLMLSKRSYGNPAFEDPVTGSHTLNFSELLKFANNQEEITAEFEKIPQVTTRTNELPEGCEVKNRYANIIPLPETRVILKTIEGQPNSDYINANYVTGPKSVRGYYIACQAPMQNTIDDFWRMIWEQQSTVILMLTHLYEQGIEKCVDYLPPSEVLDCHRLFGDFQVTLKKREVKNKYIISSLQLKNMVSNSWREVTHFWYLEWPEKGVPDEANSIITFLLEARSHMKTGEHRVKDTTNGGLSTNPDVSPVVVHCSPGTGRTGTVIACDIAIREFELTRHVDIPRIVYSTRRDRASSVQTKEQYGFIYKVINFYATKLAGGVFDSF